MSAGWTCTLLPVRREYEAFVRAVDFEPGLCIVDLGSGAGSFDTTDIVEVANEDPQPGGVRR